MLRFKPWDEAVSASKRPELEEIQRIVARDRLRLQEHLSRVVELPEDPPAFRDVLHLTRSDEGLAGSVEIRDLLHYLADRVWHYVEAYGVDETGNVIHPRVLPDSAWHCTRQGAWSCHFGEWHVPGQ